MNWQNDITEIARLKEKVKKLEVALNYANTHLEAERNYRERLGYEFTKQNIDYAFYKEKYEESKSVHLRNRALKQRLSEQREIIKKLLNKLYGKDAENGGNYMCRDCELCGYLCYYVYCDCDSVERVMKDDN